VNVFASVAVWGFWALLILGVWLDELHFKGAAILILSWVIGFVASTFSPYGVLFVSYAAVLDIALVLIVFKGDVELK